MRARFDGRWARALVLCASATLAACATVDRHPLDAREDAAHGRYAFRLIGTQTFAHRLQFAGTTVGGLSGIDYDPVDDRYVLISDDRSQFAPTRFYVARLAIDAAGFHDARLQDVVFLRRADGSVYPENAADSEAIRYDPVTHDLWWSSEGARKLRQNKRGEAMLIDPFVRRSTMTGNAYDKPRGEVPLPPMFHITTDARGPRDNLVFEGLTLSVDLHSLWVAMEGPLLQDGPLPTMTAGAWSRFSRYDRDEATGDFGALQEQLAYPIDPIPSLGALTASHAQTGVSEILAVDATHLFVLERAFAVGTGWRIRLFEADFEHASDVQAIDALKDDGPPFTPMTKQLVLDFDTLGIRIDNLEGMCFGPSLPNGHRTLVLVADDNFSILQQTQMLALEIIPR
jgi:hypothetical protein